MGADFLLTAVERISATEARERLAELDDLSVIDTVEVVLGWDPDETDPEDARERIGYAIDAILAGDEPRDTGLLQIDYKLYVVTGGLSWGDYPTDSFNEIWLLDYSGICDSDPRNR